MGQFKRSTQKNECIKQSTFLGFDTHWPPGDLLVAAVNCKSVQAQCRGLLQLLSDKRPLRTDQIYTRQKINTLHNKLHTALYPLHNKLHPTLCPLHNKLHPTLCPLHITHTTLIYTLPTISRHYTLDIRHNIHTTDLLPYKSLTETRTFTTVVIRKLNGLHLNIENSCDKTSRTLFWPQCSKCAQSQGAREK